MLVLLLFYAVNYSQQNSSTNQNTQHFNSEDNQCPLWQEKKNSTGDCECAHGLKIVKCQNQPYKLRIFKCYCMTYSQNRNKTFVGSCQFTCKTVYTEYFMDITVNTTSQINEFMCGKYKRQGQLCGSCVPGYAPPAYSYSLSCVNCTTSNWAKYTAVSLLPVTAFFIFVITFGLSATSPKLNGFILSAQIVMFPPNMRLVAVAFTNTGLNQYIKGTYHFLSAVFGIWNLDFLRLVYTPFCLQPHTNTLQVLALDYLIAVYPLLLVALSYLLVLLYYHNVRLIVYLWKPFVPLFIRFRKQWNIRSSLVDAFATFLLLSYVKILSVSVDLLLPVPLYYKSGHTLSQLYLFNQGDVPFLGNQHLPYACLALFFLLTFTLLPMLLLFLYPCSCFQVCLNRTGCSCQLLRTFMDIFQGHYKDGTNGTRDLRFFSGLYLLLRVVVYASTVVAYQIGSFVYTIVIIAIAAVSVALAQPHKKRVYNVIDACLLINTSVLYMTFVQQTFSLAVRIANSMIPIIVVCGIIAILYQGWLLFLPCAMCCRAVYQKLRRYGRCLPHKVVNREDYESLQSHCQ